MAQAYDPKTYFEDRLRKQGALYVTRAGRGEGFWDDQAKRFAEHLPKTDGRNVLDYGCGVGRMAGYLRGDPQRYLGVDLVEGAIEMAKSAHQEPWCAFETIGSDGRIPADDDAFDVSMAITVFQHIPDHQIDAVLREFARVSRGKVVIIDSNEQGSTASHMFCRDEDFFVKRLGLVESRSYVIDVDMPGSHWVLNGKMP